MRCICILSAVLYLANCQHTLTFHSDSSVARYAEGLYSDGRIKFHFRTRREGGTLFAVASERSRWVARLEGHLVVREYQLINQSDYVLSTEKRAYPPQLFAGRWTLFAAKVANQIISFQVSGETPLAFSLKQHSNRFNWSLGSDNSSFIGCVKSVKLTNQSSVYPSEVSAVLIGDACATKCNSHSCVHGRCLEFYDSAECDCSGTKYTGDRCQLEISSVPSLKYSFINQSDSSVELAPWLHRPSGRLRFQFATIHTSVPLLALSSNQMLVSCSLNSDGELTAELRNASGGQLIVFSDLFLATNSWATLLLSSVPSGLRLQVTARGLSQSAVLSTDLSGDSLAPVLGRGPGRHFIGCLKGIKVSNRSASSLVSVLPVLSRGVLIGQRCVDRCENVSCGAGHCVNGWNRHICDCSQTLKSGRFCSEPAKQIGLFGNESADFDLRRRPRLTSLSLLFRTLTEEGTLLSVRSSHSSHSASEQSAVLKLESADLQLTLLGSLVKVSVLIGGEEHSVNVSGLLGPGYSTQTWNYVSVQFHSNSLIKVTVNGAQSTLTTDLWEWNADRIMVGRGMIGCVSQLTVNRFEILTEKSTGNRNSCPTHKSLSVHIPYSQTRLQGLSINEVRLSGRLVILQLEFLLGGGHTPRGILFLSLPQLELELSCGVTAEGLQLTSAQGSILSGISVLDGAWHKLELVLRSAGNRTLVRLSVDSHSESQVFVTGEFVRAEQLIGQLRIGDNNRKSIGGCIRNAALFGHTLSLGSLLSGQVSRYAINSCPTLTACDFTPCANGATCVPHGDTIPRCSCADTYTGQFCTNTTATQETQETPLLSYLLPALLALSVLLTAGAALSVCLAVRQCDRGTGMYRTGEETGTTLMPDSLRETHADTILPLDAQEWPV